MKELLRLVAVLVLGLAIGFRCGEYRAWNLLRPTLENLIIKNHMLERQSQVDWSNAENAGESVTPDMKPSGITPLKQEPKPEPPTHYEPGPVAFALQ